MVPLLDIFMVFTPNGHLPGGYRIEILHVKQKAKWNALRRETVGPMRRRRSVILVQRGSPKGEPVDPPLLARH